jgi:hypothetical protein
MELDMDKIVHENRDITNVSAENKWQQIQFNEKMEKAN